MLMGVYRVSNRINHGQIAVRSQSQPKPQPIKPEMVAERD
jgi:hypothetical protein